MKGLSLLLPPNVRLGPRSQFVLASLAVLGAAVTARLFFAVFAPFAAGDSYEYDAIARNILDGHGYSIYFTSPTVFRAPGYPLFIAGVYAVLGPDVQNVLICQSFVAALGIWIVYLVGRELLPANSALTGSLLAAVYPHLAFYAGTLLAENVSLFFLAASIYCSAAIVRSRKAGRAVAWAFAAGVCFGLLSLTSPYLAALPVVVAPLLLWNRGLRGAWRVLVVVAIGYLVALTPWMIRNEVTFGRPVPFTIGSQGYQLWLAAARVSLYDYGSYARLADSEPLLRRWVYLYREHPERERELIEDRADLDEAFFRDAAARIFGDPIAFTKHRLTVVPYLWIQPAAYAGHFRPPFESQNPNLDRMLARGQWLSAVVRVVSILVFTVGLFGGLAIGVWSLRHKPRDVAVLCAPAIYVALFLSLLWIEQRFSINSQASLWLIAAYGVHRLFAAVAWLRLPIPLARGHVKVPIHGHEKSPPLRA